MTMPGMLAAARTLHYYQRAQDVAAHNMANVSTAAFKGERITGVQLDADGAPLPRVALDLRQGALRETSQPLDVALEGEGFLVVQTPAGERLTRGGELVLDQAGRLADRHGNPVLGRNGPIVARGRDLVIEPDGSVSIDGRALDRLRLVTAAPEDLRREEAGRFEAARTAPAGSALRVHQGRLEEANVDPLLGMVEMLSIQRAYAANTDALRTLDAALGTVTSDIGRP